MLKYPLTEARHQDGGMRLVDKRITPRGPLERLAWLAGWR